MRDIIFAFAFGFTSLIWWSPILLLLFLPIYILRKIKRKFSLIVITLEKYSDIKLEQLREFKKGLFIIKKVEKKSKITYSAISDVVYKNMVWYTRMEIIKAVPKGARVLDIGCGNGYLAKLLKDIKRVDVTCVDVIDYNKGGFKTVLYDGQTIPFPNKSFDIVLLSYVLHHSRVPEKLLKEAARVCRGRVLIYEDLAPVGKKFLAKVHKEAYNYVYSTHSPVNYYSYSEWKRIFRNSGLIMVENNIRWSLGSFLMPLKVGFFALEKRSDMDLPS